MATVSDRVEDALRRLLAIEAADLAERGKGGTNCWAAVLLKIARRPSRPADATKHPIARLIADVLDPKHAVPDRRRLEVAAFCRKIIEQGQGVGLARLCRLSRTASRFAAAALAPFGDERADEPLSQTCGRHLTVEQLMARLDPHQPFEVQATAVKVLPDIVTHELHNSLASVKNRTKQLATLKQVVGMVGGTKYFESLAPKMRHVCETRMAELTNRIERAGRKP